MAYGLGNSILIPLKLMKGVLQLTVRVKQTRPDGSFGDLEDFGNFSMRYSLNIEHGNDDSMVVRQPGHGRVQFFLQFVHGDLLGRITIACGRNKVGVVFDIAIRVIQAGMLSAIALLQEVDGHVDRDRMKPGVDA